MSSTPSHIGDVGTVVEFTAKDENGATINISAATTLEIIFRKPSQAVVTRTAVFTTDGTDGLFRYVTVAGDFDEAGKWVRQGHVVVPGVFDLRSKTVEFRVEFNADS